MNVEPYEINRQTAALFGGTAVVALLAGVISGPGAGLALIALGLLATVIFDVYGDKTAK